MSQRAVEPAIKSKHDYAKEQNDDIAAVCADASPSDAVTNAVTHDAVSDRVHPHTPVADPVAASSTRWVGVSSGGSDCVAVVSCCRGAAVACGWGRGWLRVGVGLRDPRLPPAT